MADDKNTETTTSSVQPSNPNVTATVDQLLAGVQAENAKGPQPFNESLYAGVGPTTQGAWALGKSAANNPTFTAGINGAMGYAGDLANGSGPSLTENTLLDVAQGKYLNETDPNFQAMIDRAANGTAADINASIGANGRYGSNVHANALGEQIGALRTNAAVQERNMQLGRQTDALAAIEGQRQQGVNNAFGASTLLPGLFSGAQLPAAAYGAIGAAEDADKQAALMGRYDLQQRQANARSDQLAKLTSILSGNAGASGTTVTETSPATPWWQQVLGAGAIGAGIYGKLK